MLITCNGLNFVCIHSTKQKHKKREVTSDYLIVKLSKRYVEDSRWLEILLPINLYEIKESWRQPYVLAKKIGTANFNVDDFTKKTDKGVKMITKLTASWHTNLILFHSNIAQLTADWSEWYLDTDITTITLATSRCYSLHFAAECVIRLWKNLANFAADWKFCYLHQLI